MSTVLERVQKGAALLDEKFGPEWVEKVNTKTLDLGRADRCVLGQVEGDDGDYWTALPKVGLDYGRSMDYGFNTYGSMDNLRRFWVKVIRERQK